METSPLVKMYVTAACPFCIAAKRLLDKKGVPYEVEDLSHQPEKRIWLAETTGQRTVPQIFIKEQPIGGYQELAALESKGTLDELLEA